MCGASYCLRQHFNKLEMEYFPVIVECACRVYDYVYDYVYEYELEGFALALKLDFTGCIITSLISLLYCNAYGFVILFIKSGSSYWQYEIVKDILMSKEKYVFYMHIYYIPR